VHQNAHFIDDFETPKFRKKIMGRGNRRGALISTETPPLMERGIPLPIPQQSQKWHYRFTASTVETY